MNKSTLSLILLTIVFTGAGCINQSTVDVFFPNTEQNPQMLDCGLVYPVSRQVGGSSDQLRTAIEELLKGPTEEEKTQGYFSSINNGVIINSIKVTNRAAMIDFSEKLNYQMGGSCRVTSIRSQIEETAKQFDDIIDGVVISVAGETEEILQP